MTIVSTTPTATVDFEYDPGDVFCTDMHLHQLNGHIADTFELDSSTRFEIPESVALAMYTELSLIAKDKVNDGMRRAHSGKTAYVVGYDEAEGTCEVRYVQLLYLYDTQWYLAVARRKKYSSVV